MLENVMSTRNFHTEADPGTRESDEDVGTPETLVKQSHIDELAAFQEEQAEKQRREKREHYINSLALEYLKNRFPDAKAQIDMARLEPSERLRCARAMQRLLCRDSGAGLVGLLLSIGLFTPGFFLPAGIGYALLAVGMIVIGFFGGIFSALLLYLGLRELFTGKSPS